MSGEETAGARDQRQRFLSTPSSADCTIRSSWQSPYHADRVTNRNYIKSLFTENSVATQKQYSTRMNTNTIQNTTIKSITSSFFTRLNHLLHLITKLAKATVEMYHTINLSCLFEITTRQVNSEVALAIFYYINTPSFKKFHTKAVKSKV